MNVWLYYCYEWRNGIKVYAPNMMQSPTSPELWHVEYIFYKTMMQYRLVDAPFDSSLF